MRKEFSQHIEHVARENENFIFITGDLGFMALENVKNALGKRFINAGVSEQNMVSMAAAMAYEGLIPLCYSIAPFAVFRPAEQIRVDVCLHNLNVKIVGNGGGYGYGIMGATHHALEDIAILSPFQNMRCFIPWCNDDVPGAINSMMAYKGPSYLRLGYGEKPPDIENKKFESIRKILSGDRITIVGIGPVVLNALKAVEKETGLADVFVISEIPLPSLSLEILESIEKTGRLLIVEEHVERGGIAEHIALQLFKSGITCKMINLCAHGYPNGLYGNQQYHQQINGLDTLSITEKIKALLDGQSI